MLTYIVLATKLEIMSEFLKAVLIIEVLMFALFCVGIAVNFIDPSIFEGGLFKVFGILQIIVFGVLILVWLLIPIIEYISDL